MDGLLCLGRYDRGHWIYHTGGFDGNVCCARLEIGNQGAICRSSTLDVAMFSVVMLGSCDQGDRRAGDGHGRRSALVQPAGVVGELAGATGGFRMASPAILSFAGATCVDVER